MTTTGCKSANGLELVSEESFQQRLEGMASFVDCPADHGGREMRCTAGAGADRSSGTIHKAQKSGRLRRNSPIVVCLRDSIRLSCASSSRGRTPRMTVAAATDDAASEPPVFGPTTTAANGRLLRETKTSSAAIGSGGGEVVASAPTFPTRNARGSKNFNAFLSAVERVHAKPTEPKFIAQNLDRCSADPEAIGDRRQPGGEPPGSVSGRAADEEQPGETDVVVALNNALIVGQSDAERTALAERDNVDVICNDLRGGASSSSSDSAAAAGGAEAVLPPEAFEDSDQSEETSSVRSSSESTSSSDAEAETAPALAADGPATTLTADELDRLSARANGFGIRRYEVPPDQCPECLSAYYAYTHYYAQGSKYFKIEVLNRDHNDDDGGSPPPTTTSCGVGTGADDDVFRFPSSPASPSASSGGKARRPGGSGRSAAAKVNHIGGQGHHQTLPPFLFHRHIDTVSLDLTGSDITFTVEQHPLDSPPPPPPPPPAPHTPPRPRFQAPPPPSSSAPYHSDPSLQNLCYAMFGLLPYTPGYCFIPAFYLTFPMWSVPKPAPGPSGYPSRGANKAKTPSQKHQQQQQQNTLSSDAFSFQSSQPTPPQRPWISLSPPDVTQPIAIYTVMCYNVLCDKYATRQLYGYCPSWALNWEFRKKNICGEIREYSADIINLQEVETEQFYDFFLPALKAEGYDGIFSPKSRARTMKEADRKHVDGCAIFFKHSKFSLIKEHLVEFNQLAIETAEGSHDMINRVMTKDNIGLAALLETKEAVWENGLPPEGQVRQLLLVATCHIHWDPECCDVKLIQTMMLMKKLKNILEESQTTMRQQKQGNSATDSSVRGTGVAVADSNAIPLILCGDLNSLPDSGVVEYLSLGSISADHKDFKDHGYKDSLQKLSSTDSTNSYSHAFRLSKAYTDDVMPYTNYTCDFKGTIDYIFYSRDSIRPLGILGPLDQEWFRENRVVGCPNPQIPSDHLPLLVEFEMHLPPAPSASSASSSTTPPSAAAEATAVASSSSTSLSAAAASLSSLAESSSSLAPLPSSLSVSSSSSGVTLLSSSSSSSPSTSSSSAAAAETDVDIEVPRRQDIIPPDSSLSFPSSSSSS